MTPRTLDEDTGKGCTFPKVTGVTVVGVRGHLVAVEAHVGRVSSLTLTGLPAGVQDARDRLAYSKGLRERGFAGNALMEGSGNPWWPDKAFGYGAAEWAHRSAQALSDHVSDAIGIVPVYRKVEAGGWFGQAPGDGEPV